VLRGAGLICVCLARSLTGRESPEIGGPQGVVWRGVSPAAVLVSKLVQTAHARW